MFSNIVDINKDLIIRVWNILKAVCSGYPLNLEVFRDYCLLTSDEIVDQYCWYTMSTTLHKLLEHGFQIADNLELPNGGVF